MTLGNSHRGLSVIKDPKCDMFQNPHIEDNNGQLLTGRTVQIIGILQRPAGKKQKPLLILGNKNCPTSYT